MGPPRLRDSWVALRAKKERAMVFVPWARMPGATGKTTCLPKR